SLPRALCWGALWDMTRDAEQPPRELVRVVLAGLGTESDEPAVKMLPLYVQVTLDQLTHPDQRAELRATWETGVRRLLEDAAPGSGQQLTLLPAVARAGGESIPAS